MDQNLQCISWCCWSGAGAVLAAFLAGAVILRSGVRHGVRTAHLTFAATLLVSLAAAVPAAGILTGVTEPFLCTCGALIFALDPLSAFFLLATAIVGSAGALHAIGYLDREFPARRAIFGGFFLWTLGAMFAVALCRSRLAFLCAWELMGLASAALVAFEFENSASRSALWSYLAACEAGGLLLLAFFFCRAPEELSVGWLLAGMAGFGLKIGFFLLHFWLPQAHPAAPAPVSALMSGAMIPLGFYGLLRFVIPARPDFQTARLCGALLLALGLAGAFIGIIFALAQKNVKRLLAYSSVENMGLISIAFGLAFLGMAHRQPAMMLFGFLGAFWHIANHALLKGMLFLGAGSILRSTGTLDLDRLGGLARRLPGTGACFTYGALALAGLPPFCGFAGELFIYLAAWSALADSSQEPLLQGVGLIALVVVAMTGAIAAAALIKAAAAAWSGVPRSPEAAAAEPEKAGMLAAVRFLALLSLLAAACAPAVTMFFSRLIAGRLPLPEEFALQCSSLALWVSVRLSFAAIVLTVLFAVVWLVRCILLKRKASAGPTWDCGYAAPTGRMEYTATSLSQALCDQFRLLLAPEREVTMPGNAPAECGGFRESVEDLAVRRLWMPVIRIFTFCADRVHRLQSGFLHLYVLVMILALLAMLIWGLFHGAR